MNASRPLMLNEGLLSINKLTQVDSLNIMNGQLKYAERYITGSPPAEVTFDSIQISAEGITNMPPLSYCSHSRAGELYEDQYDENPHGDSGRIPEISFRYSGSLDLMDVTRLIPSLKLTKLRIKSVSFKVQHLMSM